MASSSAPDPTMSTEPEFVLTPMSEIERRKLYEKTLDQIRDELKGEKIFISLSACDYNQDTAAYSETILNVIVGPLKSCQVSGPKQCFMLKAVPLDSYKSHTAQFLYKLIQECMELLWPKKVKSHVDDFLLLITEKSDSVIDEAVQKLIEKYPKMIHLTCMKRLLREVQENIQNIYSNLDILHRELKELVNSPSVSSKFYSETKLENIPKSFMEASIFYSRNFDQLKSIFSGDVKSKLGEDFVILKELFADPKVEQQLKLLDANYSELSQAKAMMKKSQNVSLFESIDSVEKVRDKLKSNVNTPSEYDLEISDHLNRLLEKNPGYSKLVLISKYSSVNGDATKLPDLPEDYTKDDIEPFRHAPLAAFTRKLYFPKVDQIIYADLAKKFTPKELKNINFDFSDPKKLYSYLKQFPLEFIDPMCVVNCFGNDVNQ